jgi:hypothetical protein
MDDLATAVAGERFRASLLPSDLLKLLLLNLLLSHPILVLAFLLLASGVGLPGLNGGRLPLGLNCFSLRLDRRRLILERSLLVLKRLLLVFQSFSFHQRFPSFAAYLMGFLRAQSVEFSGSDFPANEPPALVSVVSKEGLAKRIPRARHVDRDVGFAPIRATRELAVGYIDQILTSEIARQLLGERDGREKQGYDD